MASPDPAAIPEKRFRQLFLITTLIDAEEHTRAEIAQLSGVRWNAELDIRAIKSDLNLVHVRCTSPEMVRLELWTTLLAYNLIRTVGRCCMANSRVNSASPRRASTCWRRGCRSPAG
jgi:hypothetical protein